jgi:hypothetical protein
MGADLLDVLLLRRAPLATPHGAGERVTFHACDKP